MHEKWKCWLVDFITYFGLEMVFRRGLLASDVLTEEACGARSMIKPSLVGNLFVA